MLKNSCKLQHQLDVPVGDTPRNYGKSIALLVVLIAHLCKENYSKDYIYTVQDYTLYKIIHCTRLYTVHDYTGFPIYLSTLRQESKSIKTYEGTVDCTCLLAVLSKRKQPASPKRNVQILTVNCRHGKKLKTAIRKYFYIYFL